MESINFATDLNDIISYKLMNKTNHTNPADDELQKVVDILKPKFPRQPRNKGTKTRYSHRLNNPLIKIGGIAAMVCVCVTIAFGLMSPVKSNAVPASQIVEQSIADMAKADSYRVEFNYRGRISDDDEIYRSTPDGEMVSGTLYVLINDGMPLTRIDWNDSQNNTAIWNGKKYIRLQNGKVVKTKSAKPLNELYQFLSFKTLPKDMLERATIEEADGIINASLKMKSRGSEYILGTAEFVRANKRLRKMSVIYHDGSNDLVMISTNSINYGIPLTVDMFMPEQ